MPAQVRPQGGVGLLLIGLGLALLMHCWLVGFVRTDLPAVLIALSMVAFGIAMIRSDRRG
ncbi:MAG: hypothetical protein HKP61_12410 [Dactylosporangium sp.]|nr:hypothetical protein [Dactylosporangium sp.]NNJ61722.1 hypothetical protein [Dactylosporangium sp.]